MGRIAGRGGLGPLEGRTLKRPWRLILSPPAPGAWNMALDEALAGSVRAGGLPVLRFYRWSPDTLSLGRFQNFGAGLSDRARSVPTVRRTTGGGAIWHADEITYSLSCTQDDLGTQGVKASFERLCGFLLDTWRSLGWEAGFAKDAGPGGLGAFTPACFAGKEEYDILVNGRKLGGNAQRRDRALIFQHGSVPLTLDHAVLEQLFLPGFRPDPEAVTDLRSCGWAGGADGLVPLLASAFSARMGSGFAKDQPSPSESAAAGELVAERYGRQDWTENGAGTLRLS